MSFSKDEILIQNIVKCSADAQISSAEIDLLVSELFEDAVPFHKSVWDVKNSILQKYEILQNSYTGQRSEYDIIKDRLLISKYVSEKFKSYTDMEQSISAKPDCVNVAYWYSNSAAKEAVNSFSKLFSSCRYTEAESFVAVCESIVDDNILGVLPVANSNDGRLMSFYRLLDKYDLKISAVHNVENANGDGFSRFALVGKKLYNIGSTENKNLEFTVCGKFSPIIYTMEFVKGTVKEITSIPSSHAENECINYITAMVNEKRLYLLWWYLYLFGGDVEFIGVYTEI